MTILSLLGVLVTLQWGPPCGLTGYYNLVQGTPVPITQPKAQVQLNFNKAVLAGPCEASLDLTVGSYVIALQSQNSNAVPFESNRVAIIINPDGSKWTDTPAPPTGGLKSPTNFRFPDMPAPPPVEYKVSAIVSSTDTNPPVGQEAYRTLDNDLNTRWLCNGFPHYIVFDLGTSLNVSSVLYQESWSRVQNFDVFVSNDVNAFGTAVASGSMPTSGKISFPPKVGRYVKFVAKSSNTGGTYAYTGELSFFVQQ